MKEVILAGEHVDVLEDEDLSMIIATKAITLTNIPYLLQDLQEAKKQGKKEYKEWIHATYEYGSYTYDIEIDLHFTFSNRWNLTSIEPSVVIYNVWDTTDTFVPAHQEADKIVFDFINSNLYGK